MSDREAYWKANISLVTGCLVVWFIVSFGFGIMLAEPLNNISLGGYKLGFWFAQQGSMYGFVAIIFIYAKKMAALDRKYDLHD